MKTTFFVRAGMTLFLSLMILDPANQANAQGLIVNAQISGTPSAGGYDYTILLNNGAGSDGALTTFWYAWNIYDYNFMYSVPSNAQSPGWTPIVTGNGYYYNGYDYSYDGWGIEFIADSGGLAPGQSATFTFTSPDAPEAIGGESFWYPGYQVGTSYVYSSGSGSSSSFVVQSVPEPSLAALFWIGAIGLLMVRKYRFTPVLVKIPIARRW